MKNVTRPLALATACCLATIAPTQGALNGSHKTEHFDMRFREGSRAEASVDRVAARVEEDLSLILREVGLKKFAGMIRLCLYDDVAELQKITGVAASGYSAPLCSHVPHDNDQTRVHELVHVVAERFRERGPEKRNLFFAEGLANAVLRFVDNIHVDCVAAFHKQRGDLPAMVEIHELEDFYKWMGKHRHVGSYDVAGSWMRFLLDAHGPAKVRRYYRGVAAKKAFGKGVAALERDWHAHLDKVVLRAGTRRVLQQRLGRTPAERDPEGAALASVIEPESAWSRIDSTTLRDPESVEVGKKGTTFALSGKPNEGDWCEARFEGDHGDVAVRCVVLPEGSCFGVKIQLGNDCQAIVLRGQGAFLYHKGRAASHAGGVPFGKKVQIILRRRGNRASAWIDGKLLVEGEVDSAAAPIGIGCVGGPAKFREIYMRTL